ncbi:metal ABC transporter permease [Paenibacillus sp. F411]|uniref:metal ABC transporter permease n=1 Tax=Paenibacillus sp. F411 TaxID=2820239 RepID=UPI001AAE755E|nr:metal ABC transporter permease [Paenibacillus sp. F411]MBO2944278.1 metal ABC transporter permease [Paenibacillus sp. F411]
MEMLHYDFMQRAFCAGGIIAIVASVLGVYLMLRRQALMADMLAHVSLAGVAGGVYLGLNPTITGIVIVVIGAVVVEYVRKAYNTYSEISIAIIMIGGLSSAVILMSLSKNVSTGFTSYLFGSVVAINQMELFIMSAAAVIGGIFFFLMRRPLYQIIVDEEAATANGLPVQWISLGFSIVTGMIVAAAMPIVGVLLVSSLIVLPASLAIRIASSFAAALVISMLVGVSGVFLGLTASYELSTPPGGTIAFVLLLMLILGTGMKRLVSAWKKGTQRKERGMENEKEKPARHTDRAAVTDQ